MTILTLDFLRDLAQNNNRDWFEKNKKTYEAALKGEFTPFIQKLIDEIKKFEPEVNDLAKDSLFRIYRDARFSQDKTPYKTYFSAIIGKNGKKGMDYPGFYMQLEQGRLSIGGGAYFLEKDKLFKVRNHILQHQDEFLEIINDKNFIDHFEAVKGEKNVRIEADFKAISDKTPLILNKQFYVMAEIDPKTVLMENGIEIIINHCKAMQKFNHFLIAAAFV
jgi:uncharacterized protein (TIGR02453 family)